MAVKNVKRVRCGCPHGVRSHGALLLIFVLLFSFPFSAFANIVTPSEAGWTIGQKNGNGSWVYKNEVSIPYTFTASGTMQNTFYVKVTAPLSTELKATKGDTLHCEFQLSNYSGYTTLYSDYIKVRDYSNFPDDVKTIFYDESVSLYSYDKSSGVITCDVVFPKDVNMTSCQLEFAFHFGIDSSKYNNIYFGLQDVDIDVKDETKGLLNTILEWLRSIKDRLDSTFQNISNGFSNIGTWLSEKFSNLNTWLTDIKNNVTNAFSTWFNNLSIWLTNLKNDISEFFSILGEKIYSVAETLYNWFLSWFTIDDEWKEDYKSRWSTFLHNRFGGLFDAFTLASQLNARILELFQYNQPDDITITIPTLHVVTFGGEVNFRLFDARSYSFSELIDLWMANGVDWYGSWVTVKDYIDMAINALFMLWGLYHLKQLFDNLFEINLADKRGGGYL